MKTIRVYHAKDDQHGTKCVICNHQFVDGEKMVLVRDGDYWEVQCMNHP